MTLSTKDRAYFAALVEGIAPLRKARHRFVSAMPQTIMASAAAR